MNNNKLRGKFKFKMTFETKEGHEIFVQGACCVLYCYDDGAVLKDKMSCFFGHQGYNGRLESTIPIIEINCFQ